MNLYKRDYNKLYLLQDKFLNWYTVLGLPFYLTGGTALGRFYLNHRYSEDLDFFVNDNNDFPKHILIIKNELQKHFKADISTAIVTDEFARFFIDDSDTLLKLEFVNDVAYRVGLPVISNLGEIDTVINILSNKLTSIVGRDEPKDVFDLVTIAVNYSFNWLEIFKHAKEKAMINEIDVEQRMFSFPVNSLSGVDWLNSSLDTKKFGQQLRIIADDFILGKDNSLGKNKTGIENAKISGKTGMS